MNSLSYYCSAEFVYTTLLKPAPLRFLANQTLMAIVPKHLKTMGVLLALNPRDPVISGALTLGVYEAKEVAWFQQQLTPGMVALDIGANVGLYSAVMAKGVGSSGKVYAFEPDSTNYSFLKQTLAINHFDQVLPLEKACGEKPGRATLFRSPHNKGDHRLYEDPSLEKGDDVEVVSVDSLLPDTKIDIIKMDIQGYEYFALKGMENMLRRSERVIIFSEFWPKGLAQSGSSAGQLLAFCRDLGFAVFEFQKGNLVLISPVEEAALIDRYPGRKYGNIILKRP